MTAEVKSGEMAAVPGLHELEESFCAFNELARSLVDAYGRLEGRAVAVETRLGTAHRALAGKLGELDQVNAELSGVLSAIPCGVVVADSEGVIRRVNPAGQRILGLPESEMVGRSARSLSGSDGEPLLTLWSTGAGRGEPAERRLCSVDGTLRYLVVSVHRLPGGGCFEIMEDRTELSLLREQLHRLDQLAAVGEAAAGVAHEIRNPINGVHGFAGLLENALDSGGELSTEDLARYANRIRKGAAEVSTLVSSILSWARPQAPGTEAVDLVRLVREVVEESFATETEVKVALPEEGGKPLIVRGDGLKLKLALANLVRNAIEAAGEGGKVEVGLEASAAECRITVEDDGPGIDPAIRPRLFTPFATNKPKGTGLGLAISSKLLALHGGDIVAGASALGGARFQMILPLAKEGVAQ